MKFDKSIITALLLLSIYGASAQRYRVELQHYGVENGLSHREVETIFQDTDGFIWLGTRFGLNRFDGYTFKSWTNTEQGLNFNDISRIFQDDTGWLWLFNSDRTFIFLHPRSGELHTAAGWPGAAQPFTALPDGRQHGARRTAMDAAGRFHFIVSFSDPDAKYLSPESFPYLSVPFNHRFVANIAYRIFKNPVRQMTWALHPEGWRIFDADHRLQLTLLRGAYPADFFTPNCIYVDRQGRVWLGGDYGLTMVDIQPDHFQRYFSFSGTGKKPFNNSTRGIWADETDIYANFEMGGWAKMPRHPASPSMVVLDRTTDSPGRLPPGLYGYWGRPLLHNPDGSFWIGADHSIRRLDARGHLLDKFTFEPGTPAADFWSIYPDPNGRLWLGYGRGLAYKDPGDPYIRRLHLSGMDTFPATLVLHLAEDRENQLWLCTNRGLFALDRTNNTAIRYGSRDTGRYWLPADDFQHLYQDKQGIYWLATSGNGLLRWDRRSGQVRRITQAQGLSSDNIYAVYEDAAERLWLSSDYGIMQLEKPGLPLRFYLPKDGLAQEEFNRIAHFQAADGTIFMGGLNGITAFNPKDFYPDNHAVASAPLRITRFQQFNRQRELVDRSGELWENSVITVSPEDPFFQLEFALLAFENVEKSAMPGK